MNFIVEFDYAAIFINIILLIFYYPQRNLPSSSNRMFKMQLAVCSATAVFDVLTAVMNYQAEGYALVLLYLINIIYFASQNLLPALFFLYTQSFVDASGRHNRKRNLLHMIPYGIVLIIIVSTPFTNLAFSFVDGVYHQGVILPALYVVAALYLFSAMFLVIRFRSRLSLRKRTAVYIFIIFTIISLAIQFIVGNLLITNFAAACSCLIMYMMLQNSNESIDRETHLFTREAFFSVLSDYISSEQPFVMIAIVPNNTKSILEVLGHGAYIEYIRKVGDFMKDHCSSSVYIIEKSTIVIFCDETTAEGHIKQIKERFEQPWSVEGVNFVKTVNIAYIAYPAVGKTTEEVLDAVNETVSKLKESSSGEVVYSTSSSTRYRRLNELEKQKLILEAESREAIKAKEKAEQADKEKSRFLANMSHEIRTPMNAIVGMTDLILNDEINDRVRQKANDIKTASDSLVAIIDDMLDISKVEDGQLELENEEYSLRKMIVDVVNIVSVRTIFPDVEFFVNVDLKAPARIIGDENRVKQIMINILDNSIRLTKKGSITLTVKGDIIEGRYHMHVDVVDTGVGMREKEKGILLNPLSSLNDNTSRYFEGTELGLTLCRKLLEKMGGTIDVENLNGKGSRFWFEVVQGVSSRYNSIYDEVRGNGDKCVLIIKSRFDEIPAGFEKALDELGLGYAVCESSSQVEEAMRAGKITHVFSFKRIYSEYADWLRDYGNPRVVLFREADVRYEDVPDVFLLERPIYSLGINRAMNSEETIDNLKTTRDKISAPDAAVLVVDDNIVNLKVISGLLKCYDINAETVVSGFDAIEKATKKNYDIIFMDHMMPKMDGIEAMHKIHELGGYNSSVCIVALTANAIFGVKNMFLSEGFDEYLSKPVDMSLLESVLKRRIPKSKLVVTKAEAKEEKIVEERPRGRESVVKDELPQLTGVDTRSGIKNCGGQTDRYIEVLDTFYKSGIIQREQMRKLYDIRSFNNLKIEVHALKSISASIGAKELSELARSLEEAIKREQTAYVDERIADLFEMLSTLINELEDYFTRINESGKKSGRKEFDKKMLLDEIEIIIKALGDFDDEVAKTHAKRIYKYDINDAVSSKTDELVRSITLFKYEEGENIARQLAELIESEQ